MDTIGQKPPEVNRGDVVYFRKFKKTSERKDGTIACKGHAFGILLGEVPLNHQDPQPDSLIELMGMCGFVMLDDIAEFLGEEQAKLIIKMHAEKYEAKALAKQEAKTDTVVSILDSKGSPLRGIDA